MKKYQFLIGCAIFVVIFSLFLNATIGALAEDYPTCGKIIKIDYQENLIYIKDFSGNVWVYEGVEDWVIGDIVAMIMDDMNTAIIYDDEIKVVRYCGWVE